MHFRIRRRLGLYWCIPAMLFLFNPVVAFVDVLPDAIGYLLLCIGLRQAADLNGRIDEARTGFQKMLYVSLGVLVAEYYLYGVLSESAGQMNAYETPVWILLCSFILLVLQWIFLIPALRELFLGFDVLSREQSGERTLEKRGKSIYERLASFSAIFVILQSTLSCLPELSVLTPFEVEAERLPFDWYAFVGLFRLVAGFAAFVIGLVWLVRTTRALIVFLKNRALMHALESAYADEVLPRTGVLTLRRIRFAFVFFILGSVFMLNLRIDSQSVLPSYLVGVLFCLSLPFLESFFEGKGVFVIVAAAQSLCSIAQMLLCKRYLDAYTTFEHSKYDPDAYAEFLWLRGVQVADALLTLLLVLILLKALFRMVAKETAEIYANDVTGASRISTARLHKKFNVRIFVVFLLCTTSAIAKCADAILQLDYPFLWYLSGVLTLAAIIGVCALLHSIADQLEWQYSTRSLNKSLE